MEQDQFITLLNKHLQGTLSVEENLQFQQLLQSDVINQELFDYLSLKSAPASEFENEEATFQSVLSKIGIADASESFHDKEGTDAFYETISSANYPNTLESRRWYQKNYAIAAIVVPILVILSFWIFHSQSQLVPEQHYTSKKGEKRIINLPDGTTVWLNGGSTLYLENRFGKTDRRVRLEGEGFFSVAHDRAHPFIVKFKDSEVKVLGTRFNIRAYPDEEQTETSLVEGAIEMKTNSKVKPFPLKPGDKIALLSQGSKHIDQVEIPHIQHSTLVIQEGEDLPSETMWMQNKLSFNADPLSLVASKISKWYDVTIKIDNPALEQIVFSGNMEGFSLDQILAMLQQANPSLQIKKQNKTIIIH